MIELPMGYFLRKAGFGEWYWVEGACGFVVTNTWSQSAEEAKQKAAAAIVKEVARKRADGIGSKSWFYNWPHEYQWVDNYLLPQTPVLFGGPGRYIKRVGDDYWLFLYDAALVMIFHEYKDAVEYIEQNSWRIEGGKHEPHDTE